MGNYLIGAIFVAFYKILGLTGIDRMCNDARKHAGSWDKSLER